MASERSLNESRDCYGFRIKVTLEQQQARLLCQEALEKREAKWEPFFQKKRLPPQQKLKKYLRKVGSMVLTRLCVSRPALPRPLIPPPG